MSEQYPYLRIIGVPIIARPKPHVRFSDLKKALGQWRYGLALRMGWSTYPSYGPSPGLIEGCLANMASTCKKTWPEYWTPVEKPNE